MESPRKSPMSFAEVVATHPTVDGQVEYYEGQREAAIDALPNSAADVLKTTAIIRHLRAMRDAKP